MANSIAVFSEQLKIIIQNDASWYTKTIHYCYYLYVAAATAADWS